MLDRFSHIALKLTLNLQNLCSFFRFALFDGEIYPLEPISKRVNRHVVISVIKCFYLFIIWVLAFLIFVSNGTVSSKISIFSSILSTYKSHKLLLGLAFLKCGLPFLSCQYYQRYYKFCSDFNFMKWSQNCRNLNENVYISGDFETPKNADHSWEVPRLKTVTISWLLTLEFYF